MHGHSRPASDSWFTNRRAWSPDRSRSPWPRPGLADDHVAEGRSTTITSTSHRHGSGVAVVEETDDIELTVVMPCLNEADTLATCIRKALTAMEAAGIDGEVIVADNGSSDGSSRDRAMRGRARRAGRRAGYGAALMGGIAGGARALRDHGGRGRQL